MRLYIERKREELIWVEQAVVVVTALADIWAEVIVPADITSEEDPLAAEDPVAAWEDFPEIWEDREVPVVRMGPTETASAEDQSLGGRGYFSLVEAREDLAVVLIF